MKIKWIRIFAVLFVLTNVSCDEEDCACTSDIYRAWEVEEFISLESMHYTKDDNYNPVIEFNENGKVKSLKAYWGPTNCSRL